MVHALQKLEATKAEILALHPQIEVAFAAIDVCDKAALEGAVNKAVEVFGGLSIVIPCGMFCVMMIQARTGSSSNKRLLRSSCWAKLLQDPSLRARLKCGKKRLVRM